MEQTTREKAILKTATEKERRRARRTKISMPILARPADAKYKDIEEVQSSVNASRDGLYFTTQGGHYHVGMRIEISLGYAPNDPCNHTSLGEVVRIERLEDGRFGIAVKIHLR